MKDPSSKLYDPSSDEVLPMTQATKEVIDRYFPGALSNKEFEQMTWDQLKTFGFTPENTVFT